MKLQDLLQERNKLAVDMHGLVKKSVSEDRAMISSEQEEFDKMSDRVGVLDSQIESIKRTMEIGSIVNEYKDEKQERKALGGQEDKAPDYGDVFGKVLRHISSDLSVLTSEERKVFQDVQKRAQSKATDAAGAYLVPDDFLRMIIKTQKAYGGIEQFAMAIPTSTGALIKVPTNDDTGNVAVIVGENATVGEQDTTFGEIELSAYKYTSQLIKVSYELLQDNEFGLEAYLADLIGERMGRGQAAHMATGTGSGQPQGLSVGAASGKTAAATTAVTYDEVVQLIHSLDPSYRANARLVFNDSTFLALRLLKDADNRPLWMPNIADAVPATIGGYNYVIDQGMPDMAASAKPIVFGDLSGYAVRRVAGMRLKKLIEKYAEEDQVGYVAFQRMEAKVLNASKLKALTMAAT